MDQPQPRVDLDTYIVLDRAVCDLADRRFLPSLDTHTQLHLLASLIAQAESWLAEQVAVARDQGTRWAELGRLIGTNPTSARQRYEPTQTTRSRPMPPPRQREP